VLPLRLQIVGAVEADDRLHLGGGRLCRSLIP
jgi:hypothetical protein